MKLFWVVQFKTGNNISSVVYLNNPSVVSRDSHLQKAGVSGTSLVFYILETAGMASLKEIKIIRHCKQKLWTSNQKNHGIGHTTLIHDDMERFDMVWHRFLTV